MKLRRKSSVLFVLYFALTCFLNHVAAFELFCGKENCFEILGLTREEGDVKAVKRAYRKLSMELHPDNNKEEGATEKFQRIVNAHEVLTDETKRTEYEDFLDHPEKYYWYFLEHMGEVYSAKADATVVILGLTAIATLLHYLNMQLNYKSAVRRAKDSVYYKERIAQMVKNGEAASIEEAENIIHIDVVGSEKPKFFDLLPFGVLRATILIGKEIYKAIRWQVLYRIRKVEYTDEDKIILVKSTFSIRDDAWEQIPEKDREEMINCRVWEKAAKEEFLQRKRIEANRKGKRSKRN